MNLSVTLKLICLGRVSLFFFCSKERLNYDRRPCGFLFFGRGRVSVTHDFFDKVLEPHTMKICGQQFRNRHICKMVAFRKRSLYSYSLLLGTGNPIFHYDSQCYQQKTKVNTIGTVSKMFKKLLL